ncbi:MAG: hypothetical protein HY597_05985 [Candidatus Omnitrophica bacterium]|nr:hypothetical protein [Candidatus Omnitrophota bacterium]
MIHVITDKATPEQIKDMLQELKSYIKLAVDVRRRMVAGGGSLHADCESALLETDSAQSDVWGADWLPESRRVRFESLINIRPKQGNRSMTIADPALRESVEAIVRERLQI